MRTYDDWRNLVRDLRLPAALVDLDALEHNQDVLLERLGEGRTLRIASKSVRVPEVMRHLLDRGGDRMRGLMTYSAHETRDLANDGFDDLLLAYPIARGDEAVAFAQAAASAKVWAVVDDVAQAALLSAAAEGAGTEVGLLIDLDASWRPASTLHFGVRRSPIRTPEDAVALARSVADLPNVRLDGIMAYEAQIAGIPDEGGPRWADAPLNAIKKIIKRRSVPEIASRRLAVVQALRAVGVPCPLVNGGGTGSVVSTSADPSVTEVTAGSGFFTPHLFDGYHDLPLQPAAFFALAVVRRSDPDHLTCAGGGYVASGPPARDRLPTVHAPQGLHLVGLEGFGEVQTPLRLDGTAPRLDLGDPVICRHAKAGELCERFDAVTLVRGDAHQGDAPTYRGLGRTYF